MPRHGTTSSLQPRPVTFFQRPLPPTGSLRVLRQARETGTLRGRHWPSTFHASLHTLASVYLDCWPSPYPHPVGVGVHQPPLPPSCRRRSETRPRICLASRSSRTRCRYRE